MSTADSADAVHLAYLRQKKAKGSAPAATTPPRTASPSTEAIKSLTLEQREKAMEAKHDLQARRQSIELACEELATVRSELIELTATSSDPDEVWHDAVAAPEAEPAPRPSAGSGSSAEAAGGSGQMDDLTAGFWQHVCAIGFALREVPRAQHLRELRQRLGPLDRLLAASNILVPTITPGTPHRLIGIDPAGPHKVIVTGRGQTSPIGPYDRCILLLELTVRFERDRPGQNRRVSIIVKTNDDVRQEQLAMELLKHMIDCFEEAELGGQLWLRPYEIVPLGPISGLLEVVTALPGMPDAASSVHAVKDEAARRGLPFKDFLESLWADGGTGRGPRAADAGISEGGTPCEDPAVGQAKDNLTRSLAAYSVFCYVLQLKDRHNKNILMDDAGHIIHIDFGYFFVGRPISEKLANIVGNAPFKLPQEWLDIIGPQRTMMLKALFCAGLAAIRKTASAQKLLLITATAAASPAAEDWPCFGGTHQLALQGLKARLALDDELTPEALELYHSGLARTQEQARQLEAMRCADRLMTSAVEKAGGTKLYDKMQYWMNGIQK